MSVRFQVLTSKIQEIKVLYKIIYIKNYPFKERYILLLFHPLVVLIDLHLLGKLYIHYILGDCVKLLLQFHIELLKRNNPVMQHIEGTRTEER